VEIGILRLALEKPLQLALRVVVAAGVAVKLHQIASQPNVVRRELDQLLANFDALGATMLERVIARQAVARRKRGGIILECLRLIYWILFALVSAFSLLSFAHARDGDFNLTNAVSLALIALVCWALARGWSVLYHLDDPTRFLLQEPYASPLSRAGIAAFCGLPPIVRFVRNGKLTAYTYFILSRVCIVGVMMSLFYPFIIRWGSLNYYWDIDAGGASVVTGIVAFLACTALANMFLSAARKQFRLSITDLMARDLRRPILCLRAFRDDKLILPDPQHTMLGRLLV
jgi:hypothetical protein